jgi:S1-C subfamily serine protease
VRLWLGITGLTINKEVATYYNLPVMSGVVLVSIVRGGPADEADLEEDDIVAETNGAPIDVMESLQKEIR